ncbi:hypothetical protein AAC387_Pa01g2362 [Persea americana]
MVLKTNVKELDMDAARAERQFQTVDVGAAIGQACLLLAIGKKGYDPSSGLMPVCDVLIRANEGACNFKLWHDLLGKGSEGAVAREFKFSDIVTLSHHGERRASLSSGPSNREILDMVAYGCDVGEQLESVGRIKGRLA